MDDLKRLEQLRVIDDDFMRCVFKDNLSLAQDVLRTLTRIGDLVLTREETQRDLKRLAGARSAELDVWGIDSAGTQYDLEVQGGADPNPRRIRYYGSAMDVETLKQGHSFKELPERWVIFVMEEDPFGLGQGSYLFGTRDVWGTPLGDGTHVLYANGAYRGDDELGKLMADFCEADPDKIHNGLLADRVRYYKQDEEGIREMCKIWDDVRAEGERKGMLNSVRNLMAETGWSAQRALDALRVPEADRPSFLADLSDAR